MELKSPHRKWWENVLFVAVFVGMFAFVVNSYVLEQKAYKQRALYYQLMLMRQGINLFNVTEKRLPDSLTELAVSSFKMPDSNVNHRYIERLPVSPDGSLLDPFGNPYKYDKKLGWVMSVTPGYEFW